MTPGVSAPGLPSSSPYCKCAIFACVFAEKVGRCMASSKRYDSEFILSLVVFARYHGRQKDLRQVAPPPEPKCNLYIVSSAPRVTADPASVRFTKSGELFVTIIPSGDLAGVGTAMITSGAVPALLPAHADVSHLLWRRLRLPLPAGLGAAVTSLP